MEHTRVWRGQGDTYSKVCATPKPCHPHAAPVPTARHNVRSFPQTADPHANITPSLNNGLSACFVGHLSEAKNELITAIARLRLKSFNFFE